MPLAGRRPVCVASICKASVGVAVATAGATTTISLGTFGLDGAGAVSATTGRLVSRSMCTMLVTGCKIQLVFSTSTVSQLVSVNIFQLVCHWLTKLVRMASTARSLVRVSEVQFVLYSVTRTVWVAGT